MEKKKQFFTNIQAYAKSQIADLFLHNFTADVDLKDDVENHMAEIGEKMNELLQTSKQDSLKVVSWYSTEFDVIVKKSLAESNTLYPKLLQLYDSFIKSGVEFPALRQSFAEFLTKNIREGDMDAQKTEFLDAHGNSVERVFTIQTVYDEEGDFLYKGEIDLKTGLAHGFGVRVTSDGAQYQGFFDQGRFHIWGAFVCPVGSTYRGEYEYGHRKGRGTYIFPDGKRFEGSFHLNNIQGRGVLTLADGTKIIGIESLGRINGNATYTYSNGDRFEGYVVDGQRSGQGTFTKKNGFSYSGEYLNDLPNGKGKVKYVNGDSFEGEFVKGLFEGQGTYTWKNGTTYSGSFTQGYRNGQGTLLWGNSTYEGEWKYDKPHGPGAIILIPGKKTYGIWLRGFQIEETPALLDKIDPKTFNQLEEKLISNFAKKHKGFYNFELLLSSLINPELSIAFTTRSGILNDMKKSLEDARDLGALKTDRLEVQVTTSDAEKKQSDDSNSD